MNHPLKVLAVALLAFVLAFGLSCASAQEAVGVYWQLEEVAVSSFASSPYGDAYAQTSQQPLSISDAPEMVKAIRGDRTLSLGIERASTERRADATYTVSGFPALIPGAASARLSIAAETASDEHSHYLYCTVHAENKRVSRIRGNGAWVVRVPFPRVAVPGETRTIAIRGRELNEYAEVMTTYTYRAHAGSMLIDMMGDVVVYDANDNEILRIPQSVEDMLPDFVATTGEAKEIFSAVLRTAARS